MPGAQCARSRACSVVNTRVSHHGHTGITRHSPRNGLRLISCSPRRPGLFATVIGGVDLGPGNQSANCPVVSHHQNWEVVMTIAKIALASVAALIISSAALAQ